MTPEQERRIKAQLESLASHPDGVEAVHDIVCKEIRNMEWNAYGRGYVDGEEQKERLDARVQPGW